MKHLSLMLFYLNACLLVAQGNPLVPGQPGMAPNWDTLCEAMAERFHAGKYPEAVEYALLALEVARRDSGEASLAFGTSLDNLGVVLHHAGKLTAALPNLEAGVAHAKRYLGTDHEDYITRLSNLGMLYRDNGDYARALTCLNEVVERAEKTLGENNIYFGILLNNLALVNEESGQFDQAMRLYERAIEVTAQTDGKESAKYAQRLNNLATLQSRLGNYEQSLALRLEAQPVFEKKLGKEHPTTLNAANNLASNYGQLKQLDKELELRLELLPAVEKVFGKEHYTYLSIITSLGNNFLKANQNEKGLAILTEAYALLERHYPKSFRTLKDCTRYLSIAHTRLGNDTQAVRYALLQNRYMLDELDYRFDQMSESEQMAYFNTADKLYFDEIFSFAYLHPEDSALAGAAYNNNLALKGLLLGNHHRFIRSLRENKDITLQLQFEEWQALEKYIYRQYSLPVSKRTSNFDSLLLRSNELERLLNQSSQQYRNEQQTINWRDVQARLAPGEAAVEFCRFRMIPDFGITDSVFYTAWLVRPGDVQPRQIFLFEEKQLGDPGAIKRLYSLTGHEGEHTLRDLVWNPLEPFLKNINTLYYASAGQLHRINLGAIPINDHEVFANRFQLHHLGSTRELVFRKQFQNANLPETALVFGGIRYEADSLALAATNRIQTAATSYINLFPTEKKERAVHPGNWDYLPWTEKEAKDVTKRLRVAGVSVDLRTGFDASEALFKQKSNRPAAPLMLHLATHGYFFPDADETAISGFHAADNPLIRSGLILAGADRVWLGGEHLSEQEDGILTAFEISQLDLSGTELVVLSACETGLGDLHDSEGVYGLQRAFKSAGAKYLIMSLWNVRDHSAQEFMAAFYNAWLSEGKDIPEAFRSAQHALHSQYVKPFNPVMWAGFILLE